MTFASSLLIKAINLLYKSSAYGKISYSEAEIQAPRAEIDSLFIAKLVYGLSRIFSS